jgi:hypothetical protein
MLLQCPQRCQAVRWDHGFGRHGGAACSCILLAGALWPSLESQHPPAGPAVHSELTPCCCSPLLALN